LANGAFADNPKRLTIDSHVHVWKHDAQFPWAPDAANLPTADATAEKLLSLMEANSVSATVIIQVIYYKWDNRYLASVLKRYPGRFHGVARVNPEDPASPDTLSKLTEEDRFHGVRISPAATAAGDWIRGGLMPPLWHRCEQLKVPMTVLAPVSRMPDLERLIERFPDLTVVIDHMADSPLQQPAELEKLLVLRRYPRVFVKISHSWSLSSQGYPYRDSQQQIKRLYASFGPKRLLAGTDWPLVEKYCTYGQAIDLARRQISFLNDNDRSWICGRTAQQIWPFPNV
jgi:predicted TIM-barrel fold metal-dependent hydrolase